MVLKSQATEILQKHIKYYSYVYVISFNKLQQFYFHKMQDITSTQLSFIRKAIVCIITYLLIYIGENCEMCERYLREMGVEERTISLYANCADRTYLFKRKCHI